ncbi:hypothetical protein [Phytohabitans aurantiacus]|uniref:Uncharacterized protein n=1 Tax=Phytohabitans aurantiacus TaxID=3016789 RepID=A0ABQ5R2Q0_9ACTN|nr:hypothetical protein [Phytohabitans aurantiacus]GLI01049.1 hypothetical protein Pa4123_63250 [Phytohabitans aurantiacus]
MRIEIEWIDDVDGGLAELEAFLRQDPRMDEVPLTRGRPVVAPTSLGVLEVLEVIATDVTLGMVASALYDFLRRHNRAGTAEASTQLRLTRTDLPDEVRHVEIELSGSAATVEQVVRDALTAD